MEKHISGSQGFGVGVYYNTGLAFGSFGGMKELFHILPRVVITWIYMLKFVDLYIPISQPSYILI